ncbi:MAG: hypothetical protein ACOZAN_01120 [Patescibacteria group bacterium]
MNIEHSPSEKLTKTGFLKTRLRAVLKGLEIGSKAGVAGLAIGSSPEVVPAVASYLLIDEIIHKLLRDKPDWLQAAVGAGMAIPPLLIFNQALGDVWDRSFELSARMLEYIKMPLFPEIYRNLKDAPEFFVYLAFFLLFARDLQRVALNIADKKIEESIIDSLPNI